jgi:hypothetical protein
VSVEDVLKIVSVVLIPSIGAVVWLLSQVYGLRSDLREIQQILKSEREQNATRMTSIEASVARLAEALHDLTMDLARHGLNELRKKQ